MPKSALLSMLGSARKPRRELSTGQMLNAEQAWALLHGAEKVCSESEVDGAIRRLAQELSVAFGDRHPLLLCVMNGGVYFCGKLLSLLHFPLTLDYVHASRYGDGMAGCKVQWKVEPPPYVAGRDVLLIDDILDEGITLQAIRERVLALGASSCRIAVLAEKLTGRPKPVAADYVGLLVPDRFVFGCGLDAYGCWRNLPAIYALVQSGTEENKKSEKSV
jgi:hypoxanthine phosphoribosyltransferase